MSEVTFDFRTFLQAIDAILNQPIATTMTQLDTDETGGRFRLVIERKDGQQLNAFGPCKVKGDQVSVHFDLRELQTSILNTHATVDSPEVTIIVGDGMWVKDPTAAE